MKINIPAVKRLIACCGLPLMLSAQDNGARPSPAPDATDPVGAEVRLVGEARQAALRGDNTTADANLNAAAAGDFASKPTSVNLARRAVAVCGWLQNDNNYGAAEKLAKRTVALLATLTEANDTDREERLYWEGWLEGEALDHKVRAIALLRAAERLSPTDERVTDLELRLVEAVNTFGH